MSGKQNRGQGFSKIAAHGEHPSTRPLKQTPSMTHLTNGTQSETFILYLNCCGPACFTSFTDIQEGIQEGLNQRACSHLHLPSH